jgi:NADPH-dependent curcumin reductase CurA
LAAATPNGIDALFENVGGEILDASLARMNPFGRISLCGMIAGYDGEPLAIKNTRVLLTMRLTMRGFIVSEHMDLWPQGLKELGMLVATGKLKFRETIAQDLSAAPDAFIGLLKGKNFGKQLVKLSA